jgi:hypothetical protein
VLQKPIFSKNEATLGLENVQLGKTILEQKKNRMR